MDGEPDWRDYKSDGGCLPFEEWIRHARDARTVTEEEEDGLRRVDWRAHADAMGLFLRHELFDEALDARRRRASRPTTSELRRGKLQRT